MNAIVPSQTLIFPGSSGFSDYGISDHRCLCNHGRHQRPPQSRGDFRQLALFLPLHEDSAKVFSHPRFVALTVVQGGKRSATWEKVPVRHDSDDSDGWNQRNHWPRLSDQMPQDLN